MTELYTQLCSWDNLYLAWRKAVRRVVAAISKSRHCQTRRAFRGYRRQRAAFHVAAISKSRSGCG